MALISNNHISVVVYLNKSVVAKLSKLGRDKELVGPLIARLLDEIPEADAAVVVGVRPIKVIQDDGIADVLAEEAKKLPL